jgi:hypothetical protein
MEYSEHDYRVAAYTKVDCIRKPPSDRSPDVTEHDRVASRPFNELLDRLLDLE